MTYEVFESIINTMRVEQDRLSSLQEHRVDLFEFVLPYIEIITKLLESEFGVEGNDWISWYMYENDFRRKGLGAWDENKNPMCYDIQSLWNYLNTIKNKNI